MRRGAASAAPRLLRSLFPWLGAGSAWLGASIPVALPMVVGVAALTVALLSRRRGIVLVGICFACAVFAGNALAGLQSLPPGEWSGTVRLIGDPEVRGGATIVDVATGVGRLELQAWGAAGRNLAEAEAGDRVGVEGTISPLTRPAFAVARHVRSRLVARIVRRRGGSWWMVPTNALRSVVLAGGRPLPPDQRPVYGGFVLGDDRGRSDEITEWFDASGLSHLLVVSGENLAFVLLVASPLLDRLGGRTRVGAMLALLVLFASMTRFEPSILRATAMAMVTALSFASRRRIGGRVSLGIAVTVLLLLDPLLVHSTGFRLSVAACAGIVVLGPGLERRLRGPGPLRAVLAVTISAQVAVAPFLVPTFGPMPLVAVPANVLAEPVAGLVMMWGCTGGMLAGLVGGPIATVLQLPTRLALWWIISVARGAAALPDVGVGLPALATGIAVLAVGRRVSAHVGSRRGR